MELSCDELKLISIGLYKVLDELQESDKHPDLYKLALSLVDKVENEIEK